MWIRWNDRNQVIFTQSIILSFNKWEQGGYTHECTIRLFTHIFNHSILSSFIDTLSSFFMKLTFLDFRTIVMEEKKITLMDPTEKKMQIGSFIL
jgi:hypothetical protein